MILECLFQSNDAIVSRNNRIKRVTSCRCFHGQAIEPYEMSMAFGAQVQLLHPALHIDVPSHMTEISLDVTLNNQIHRTSSTVSEQKIGMADMGFMSCIHRSLECFSTNTLWGWPFYHYACYWKVCRTPIRHNKQLHHGRRSKQRSFYQKEQVNGGNSPNFSSPATACQKSGVSGRFCVGVLWLIKELARIHGKSAHLAKCSQLFKKRF